MIFSCARCETRYKLPDDKVTNRVVKVRCRRCGVIIVVRDPARSRGAAVETEAVWFAAIDGEQRGPLTSAALQQLVESAVLTSATFVWKVGMADWLAAREVPEIAALIDSIGPPPMPSADGAPTDSTVEAAASSVDPSTHLSARETVREVLPEISGRDAELAGTDTVREVLPDLGPNMEEVAAEETVREFLPETETSPDDLGRQETVRELLPEIESEDPALDATIRAYDATSGLEEDAPDRDSADAVGALDPTEASPPVAETVRKVMPPLRSPTQEQTQVDEVSDAPPASEEVTAAPQTSEDTLGEPAAGGEASPSLSSSDDAEFSVKTTTRDVLPPMVARDSALDVTVQSGDLEDIPESAAADALQGLELSGEAPATTVVHATVREEMPPVEGVALELAETVQGYDETTGLDGEAPETAPEVAPEPESAAEEVEATELSAEIIEELPAETAEEPSLAELIDATPTLQDAPPIDDQGPLQAAAGAISGLSADPAPSEATETGTPLQEGVPTLQENEAPLDEQAVDTLQGLESESESPEGGVDATAESPLSTESPPVVAEAALESAIDEDASGEAPAPGPSESEAEVEATAAVESVPVGSEAQDESAAAPPAQVDDAPVDAVAEPSLEESASAVPEQGSAADGTSNAEAQQESESRSATEDAPESYQGGLGDEDPTLRMAKAKLDSEGASPVADEGGQTVQEQQAAPEPPTPEAVEGAVTEPAAEGEEAIPDSGPPTRVEAPPAPTIDTQAAGAPPPQDMATQPETEAAPASSEPMELAEDLFAGVEGAMKAEDLKKGSRSSTPTAADLIRAPELGPGEDEEPSEEDKEFFKQAMRSGSRVPAMSITAIQAVDESELKELRAEFGVVGELEAARRKRQIVAGVAAALVVFGVIGAISMYQSQREEMKNANRERFAKVDSSVPVADHRAVYDAPTNKAAEEEAQRLAAEEEKRAAEEEEKRLAAEKEARAKKWEEQKAYMAQKKAKKAEDSKKAYKKMSDSDYQKLMTDSSGKSEVKLKFSARDQADKAAKEAAAKRKKKGDVRASEVVATFGRKRRQLARCKSGEDEKVRAQFTVAPNGRVTGVKVTGTQSPQKRDCVKGILKQAIFPRGPETNTYAMPFTL